MLGDGQVKTVLDAGCGNGYLLRKLSSRAEQIVGIDSSDELLSIAKKNTVGCANVSTIKNDLMKTLSLKDKTFDVVIANMVLQYLPSLENFSAECSRILKREGRFIMIIDHPSHAAYLRAQELAGKKNEKFLTSGSYFTEEKRTKKSLWNKAILEYTIELFLHISTPFRQNFILKKCKNEVLVMAKCL